MPVMATCALQRRRCIRHHVRHHCTLAHNMHTVSRGPRARPNHGPKHKIAPLRPSGETRRHTPRAHVVIHAPSPVLSLSTRSSVAPSTALKASVPPLASSSGRGSTVRLWGAQAFRRRCSNHVTAALSRSRTRTHTLPRGLLRLLTRLANSAP